MADEEDPWGAVDDEPAAETAAPSGGDTAAPAKAAGSVPASPRGGQSTPAPEGGEVGDAGAAEEQAPPPPPPPEDDGYRKPVQLYRHWVRPKFLQYKYMYNYRTNYYDDVIDYLNKRQSGEVREIPRPQTWAERVLRTNKGNVRSVDTYSGANKEDSHLIQVLAASIKTHNYHTKAYINQKYSHVL